MAAQEDISTSFEVRVDRRVPVDEKSEQGAHLQNQEAAVTTSLDLPTNKPPKTVFALSVMEYAVGVSKFGKNPTTLLVHQY